MKQFKGTPGPWSACLEDLDSECIIIYADHGIQGHIAKTSNFFNDEINETNAKLIAAAPDLLSACQQLMEVYETKGQLLSFDVSIIRSAIDKALDI